MRLPLRAALSALAAAFLAPPAGAILIRTDRDDAEYRELATRYPATLRLDAPDGTGVLIAPRWVLTAAHLAVALRDAKSRAAVGIGGRRREVLQVFVHPDWKPGGESDIALVYLREGVADVEPSPVYRESDEAGQTVRTVGFGRTGRIGDRSSREEANRLSRAAINTIDRVSPRTLGLRLKGPEEASDLQGAAAEGDFGAPAYIEAGGRILVAGIASATEDTNGDGIRGNVGDWEVYGRVSAFAAWIDGVLQKAAAAEAAALLGDTDPR